MFKILDTINFPKKGFRAYFGGGGGGASAPGYVSAESKELADEKERIGRYNEYLPEWEEFYNVVPGMYGDYLRGQAELYPERSERVQSLEDSIFDFIPRVNVLSPEFQQESQSRYDIRKERGLESLGELYDPLERKITGRAFQQYGGMENSMYRDLQSNLADKRGEAIGNYVNQIDLQRGQEDAQQLGLQRQSLQNMMGAHGLYNLVSQEFPSAITTTAGLGQQVIVTYNELINAMRQLAIQRAMMENQFNMGIYQSQIQQDAMKGSMTGQLIGAGTSLLGGFMGM